MLREQAVLLLEGAPHTLKAWTARNGIYLGRLVKVTQDRPWRAVLEVTGVIKAAAHGEGGIIRRRGYRLGELIEIGGASLMRPTDDELAHVGRSYFMTLLHELRQHQLRLLDPACSPGRYDYSSEQVLALTSVIEAELPLETVLMERRLSYGLSQPPMLTTAELASLPAWHPAGMITMRNRLQRSRCQVANRLFEEMVGMPITPTTSAALDDQDPPEAEARYTRLPDGWHNHPGDVLFTRADPRSPAQPFKVMFRESGCDVLVVEAQGRHAETHQLPARLTRPFAVPQELASWENWARNGLVETALPRVQLRLLEHMATFYGEPQPEAESSTQECGTEQPHAAEPANSAYAALSTYRGERGRMQAAA